MASASLRKNHWQSKDLDQVRSALDKWLNCSVFPAMKPTAV